MSFGHKVLLLAGTIAIIYVTENADGHVLAAGFIALLVVTASDLVHVR